ncbi:hypothetical protein R1flu_001434 [Riccia fluitans]|uniref:Uncharacterized protein n=1 Tax=Riccia fluitans TaxID=41844 RepID=A0ABD1Y798_9MARC
MGFCRTLERTSQLAVEMFKAGMPYLCADDDGADSSAEENEWTTVMEFNTSTPASLQFRLEDNQIRTEHTGS